jgi:FtsP/CotA-like multicopper oxidase with cupredoxin domain
MARVSNGFVSFTARNFYYNGVAQYPGPTLVVNPGDWLNITIVNNLGENDMDLTTKYQMMDPNTTNIHTHGLHVDPNVDSILIHIEPGESYTYNIHIPSNHAPGLHWYHSHKHGSSALQVMGGLVGAIYVNPITAQVPTSVFNGFTRQLLQFQHFSTASLNPTTDPLKVYTYLDFQSWTADTTTPSVSWYDSTQQDVYLVNGQFQPTYNMTTGQGVIFDILNGVGDHMAEIQIFKTVGNSSGALEYPCSMSLLAIDGVYLSASRAVTYIPMVPGGRSSVLVQCNTAGTFYLQSFVDTNTRSDMANSMVRYNQVLVKLQVTGATQTTTQSVDLSQITRPSYLADLQTATPNHYWETMQDLRTSGPSGYASLGFGQSCASTDFDPTTNTNCQYIVFNDTNYPLTQQRHIAKLGTVEQFHIIGSGTSPAHNIHIHVNHFQIVNFANGPGNVNLYTKYWGQIGDWRDTVPANPGNTTVRYPLNTYTGNVIIHCHILMHEDEGMMGSFYVGEGMTACSYPDICYTNGTIVKYSGSATTISPTPTPTKQTSATPTPTPTVIFGTGSNIGFTWSFLVIILLLAAL